MYLMVHYLKKEKKKDLFSAALMAEIALIVAGERNRFQQKMEKNFPISSLLQLPRKGMSFVS
jgi:hypothetical protein